MSPCHPFRPVPGQCGPNRRGPLPAPPFDPRDYWATRKCVSRLFASLETKLDKADVVDPSAATEVGQAADAKKTQEKLNGILAKLAKKADSATTLAGYGITDAATKAEIAAKADLAGGKVPAAQLPSYVDDVLEYGTMSAFPATGEGGKIYVAKDTNLVYRWSGTQYVEISPSPTLDDAVTETSSNGVKSSGIWSWVKSLLPYWLTSDYAEPATAASVKVKADKATTLAGYGITDAVPFVKDSEGFKTAVKIGTRVETAGPYSLSNGELALAIGKDSHAEGIDTIAFAPYSYAGGVMVQTLEEHPFSYVWNGDETMSAPYDSHGKGTFNINPVGGLAGFYIGEQTLHAILTNKADKVAPSAAGNLAALTADGDIEDSGKKPSDFRETTDNTCHKTEYGEWTFNPSIPSGYSLRYEQNSLGYWGWFLYDANGKKDGGGNLSGAFPDATNITVPGHEWSGGYSFTATRSAVCSDGRRFVTEDFAAKKSDIFGNDGKPSDMFTTNLLGKPVANIKANSSAFASEYSATSAYSVGAFVYHDGSIYQCKTAIADGGEAWNAEHWELGKLDDFFTESNSLLTSRVNTMIDMKVGDVNAVLAAALDGTEVA